MSTDTAKSTKRPRGPRSPGYPAINLESAIKQAEKLKAYAPNRKPIPIDTAINQWGYQPKSGAGLQQISTLKKYGLLIDQGRNDQRVVVLTDRAWQILTDPRPDSTERARAIREAAVDPKIHGEIRERWPHGLPDNTTMQVWLVQEKKFNEDAVLGFLSVLRSTFEYAKLDSEPGTGDDTPQDEDTQKHFPKGKKKPLTATPEQPVFTISLPGDGELQLAQPESGISEDNKPIAIAWIKSVLKKMLASGGAEPDDDLDIDPE